MPFPDYNTACRPLRILIVDDNHINLSVLSTLLKRRFSRFIDGAPISVDSGLKAIQLLRTHVFDCIFMDIQMPFLSGLEASRRIRNAEDGILPANSDAHIVAVTTAVGDEPALAYRRAEMDGMIGKPVHFKHLQQYLLPLAHEAFLAAQTVPPFLIDGEEVMPPLPPASKVGRVFYLPADAVTPSSRPDICEGSDFEKLLQSQTRASLRRFGDMSVAMDSVIESQAGVDHTDTTLVPEVDSDNYSSTATSRSNSIPKMEKMQQSTSPKYSPLKLHSRAGSMSISQRTLSKQIAREVANADLSGEMSDSPPEKVTRSTSSSSQLTLGYKTSRPHVARGLTSPAWLLSVEENENTLRAKAPIRPRMSIHDHASSDTSESSDGSSSYDPHLRRVSQTSTGSTSSDVSSAVSTPACDSPIPFWSSQGYSYFGKRHDRTESSSTVNPLSSGDSHHEAVEGYWDPSSETAPVISSPMQSKLAKLAEESEGETFSSPFKTLSRRRDGPTRDSLQELAQSMRHVDITT